MSDANVPEAKGSDDKQPSPEAARQAADENRRLQDVIGRHETFCFRIKGWCVTAFAVLVAALFSKQVLINKWELSTLAVVVYTGFVAWLLYHRVIIRRAIDRVKVLESKFEHSKITETLSKPIHFPEFFDRRDLQVLMPIIIGACLLMGVIVLANWGIVSDVSRHVSPGTPEVLAPGPGPGGGPIGGPAPAPSTAGERGAGGIPAPGNDIVWIIGLLVIAGTLIVCVAWGRWAKAAGIIAISGGVSIAVVKELKIEHLLSVHFETGGKKAENDQRAPEPGTLVVNLSEAPGFGAAYLGGVANFRVGASTIDKEGFETAQQLDDAKQALDTICGRWRELAQPEAAMILIVGATDRLPLAGKMRTRYDANTGLALARAAAVRDHLAHACWTEKFKIRDENNVLLLVSGPQTTPAEAGGQARASPNGFPKDRRADVWALVSVPFPRSDIVKSVRGGAPTNTQSSSGGDSSAF
jgi:hypothetical protein